MIYQSGYLTIKDFNPEFNIYTLGFPNDEVKYGFLNFIAPFYTESLNEAFPVLRGRYIEDLLEKASEIIGILEAAFKGDVTDQFLGRGQEAFAPLHAHLQEIGRSGVARDGTDLAIQLGSAHAHLIGYHVRVQAMVGHQRVYIIIQASQEVLVGRV